MVLFFLSGWLLERLCAGRKALATLIRTEDGEWEVEWEDLSEGRATDTSTMTLLREQVPTQAPPRSAGGQAGTASARVCPTDGKDG